MKYTIDEVREFIVAASSTLPSGSKMPDLDLMVGIAFMESAGDPFAHRHNKNGSIDRGLWQINSVHKDEFATEFPAFRQACYTPVANAKLALLIWQKQGYIAWSTYDNLP